REHWSVKDSNDGSVLSRWVFGSHFDFVSTGVPVFSSLRQYVRRREHVGNDGPSGPGPGLVIAGALLFFGVACWGDPGAGVHVVDCGVYASDLPNARGEDRERALMRSELSGRHGEQIGLKND